MRTTPHNKLKKSEFDLHFGREPNTELSNMLKINEIKKLTNNHSFSAKPETLQVYIFRGKGGEGSSNDHLSMKQKRKSTMTVSKYPLQFFKRKNTKTEFESPYSVQLQTAVKETNHIVTIADNRTIHLKLITKPLTLFEQEPSTVVLDQEDRTEDLPRKEDNTPATPDRSPLQDDPTNTRSEIQGTLKSGTFSRGRPKLIRNRE